MSFIIIVSGASMSVFKYVVFYSAIFKVLSEVGALVELPRVEENDIIRVENATRAAVNKIFSALNLKDTRKNKKLTEYSLIHNYFISLTLQDHSSLKQIAKLSRVDKTTISNEIADYIALLNEILDDDNESDTTIENVDMDYINKETVHYMDNFFRQLANYKKHNTPRILKPNTNFLKGLERNAKIVERKWRASNSSSEDDNNILHNNQFWNPKDDDVLLFDPKAKRIHRKPKGGRRMFKAKNVKIRTYPFVASVMIFRAFHCGGAIIGDDLVLTAASCVQIAWNNRYFRENPLFLSVRIGSAFFHGGGEEIAVLEVYFHPTYNPAVLKNNLAVLRLSRKIIFGKKKRYVKKIELDKSPTPLPMNAEVTALGFGARQRADRLGTPWVNRLGSTLLSAYSLKECEKIYTDKYVRRENFCAGYVTRGDGACNNDVGGPAVLGAKLVGIISFGSPVCGTPDSPTVFSKVGYFYEWIETIMEQEYPTQNKKTTLSTKPTFAPFLILTTPPFTIIPQTKYDMAATAINNPSNGPNDFEEFGRAFKAEEFLVYLRTIFNSAEIDEFIDLNNTDNEAIEHNLRAIKDRQAQLAYQEKLLKSVDKETRDKLINNNLLIAINPPADNKPLDGITYPVTQMHATTTTTSTTTATVQTTKTTDTNVHSTTPVANIVTILQYEDENILRNDTQKTVKPVTFEVTNNNNHLKKELANEIIKLIDKNDLVYLIQEVINDTTLGPERYGQIPIEVDLSNGDNINTNKDLVDPGLDMDPDDYDAIEDGDINDNDDNGDDNSTEDYNDVEINNFVYDDKEAVSGDMQYETEYSITKGNEDYVNKPELLHENADLLWKYNDNLEVEPVNEGMNILSYENDSSIETQFTLEDLNDKTNVGEVKVYPSNMISPGKFRIDLRKSSNASDTESDYNSLQVDAAPKNHLIYLDLDPYISLKKYYNTTSDNNTIFIDVYKDNEDIFKDVSREIRKNMRIDLDEVTITTKEPKVNSRQKILSILNDIGSHSGINDFQNITSET